MESVQTTRPLRLEALIQVEASCRSRLASEPADVAARKKLAWCLFILALHQAGQETLIQILPSEVETVPHSATDSEQFRGRDARQLLRECLRQTVAVRQLTTDAQDLLEIDRLQSLVRLSGGEAELTEAEREARSALAKMAHELLQFPPRPQPSRRRSRRLAS